MEKDYDAYKKMSESNKLPTFPIQINAFEAGVLIPLIWKSETKDALKSVFKQLEDLSLKFRQEAGVKVEYVGKGKVKLTDRHGDTITREIYPWETGKQ